MPDKFMEFMQTDSFKEAAFLFALLLLLGGFKFAVEGLLE